VGPSVCFLVIKNNNNSSSYFLYFFPLRYKFFKILHEKYGNVVRLNPTTISVCDKDMVNQILVTDDLPKAPIYDIFAGKPSD
jgi:hypothetical protein